MFATFTTPDGHRGTQILVTGPWIQEEQPLWASDRGHGMMLRLDDGRLLLALHQPNTTPDERAVIREVHVTGAGGSGLPVVTVAG